MIDVDAALWVEFEANTKHCVGLIETARDIGQNCKPATVLHDLARRASVPAFVVLYSLTSSGNPADPQQRDIDKFRVRRVAPVLDDRWTTMTPHEYAVFLLRLRKEGGQRLMEQAWWLDMQQYALPGF